jgi:tetratricopeptide (TPR) repeat protein
LSQYTFEGWDDSANYLLAEKYNLEEALKYSDRSVGVEERFDNLMTKAAILDALSRKPETEAVRKQALPLGNPTQLHGYGRQLQAQGKQEEAFEIFRANMKKNPNHWTAHNEAARLAVAKGDFDTAVKEMKLSKDVAPDPFKPALDAIIKRLEKKEDINK